MELFANNNQDLPIGIIGILFNWATYTTVIPSVWGSPRFIR